MFAEEEIKLADGFSRVLNHGINIIRHFVILMDMQMMMNYLNEVVDLLKIRKDFSKSLYSDLV